MRSLVRDGRYFYYANVIGTEPILDEYGNDTLEERKVYSERIKLRKSVSGNAGQEAVDVFGAQTEYSRTISFAGECPLKEGSKVWFDDVEYIVVRIADSKHATLVLMREVSPRA